MFLPLFMLGASVMSLVFSIVWYLLTVLGLWFMFEKAGEAGWKALIPVYNVYILFKISWGTPYFWIWALFSVLASWLSPSANFLLAFVGWLFTLITNVLQLMLCYRVSRCFGHNILVALGLYFFTPLEIMYLGFGRSSFWSRHY